MYTIQSTSIRLAKIWENITENQEKERFICIQILEYAHKTLK